MTKLQLEAEKERANLREEPKSSLKSTIEYLQQQMWEFMQNRSVEPSSSGASSSSGDQLFPWSTASWTGWREGRRIHFTESQKKCIPRNSAKFVPWEESVQGSFSEYIIIMLHCSTSDWLLQLEIKKTSSAEPHTFTRWAWTFLILCKRLWLITLLLYLSQLLCLSEGGLLCYGPPILAPFK